MTKNDLDSLLVYRVRDAAKLLSVAPNTIYAAIHSGKLTAIKPFGCGLRIRRTEIERLLNECSSSSLGDIGASTSASTDKRDAPACAPRIVVVRKEHYTTS